MKTKPEIPGPAVCARERAPSPAVSPAPFRDGGAAVSISPADDPPAERLTVTTRHPASCYGMPVILDGSGAVLAYPDGFRRALKRLRDPGTGKRMTVGRFAALAALSPRTVEGWMQRKAPPMAAALNLLGDLLDSQQPPPPGSAALLHSGHGRGPVGSGGEPVCAGTGSP